LQESGKEGIKIQRNKDRRKGNKKVRGRETHKNKEKG
jgi:hypothetical protein